jgi:hypothetical protein
LLPDRGYFQRDKILRCEKKGINKLVPKPLTSNGKADGRFDVRDLIYIETEDEY